MTDSPDSTAPGSMAPGPPDDRRDFLTKAAAIIVGGIVSLAPLAVGLVAFFDPLLRPKRKSKLTSGDSSKDKPGDRWIKVASLDALSPNGIPQAFQVISDRWDAWNYFPNEPLGGIYLQRMPEGKSPAADSPSEKPAPSEKPVKVALAAFSATCPHLGCFVEYRAAAACFKCPCHESVFTTDGKLQSGVSPRGMDALEVEVRGGDIWVNYQKFKTGKPERTVN